MNIFLARPQQPISELTDFSTQRQKKHKIQALTDCQEDCRALQGLQNLGCCLASRHITFSNLYRTGTLALYLTQSAHQHWALWCLWKGKDVHLWRPLRTSQTEASHVLRQGSVAEENNTVQFCLNLSPFALVGLGGKRPFETKASYSNLSFAYPLHLLVKAGGILLQATTVGQHVSVYTERLEYTTPGAIMFTNRLRKGVLLSSFDTEWAEIQKHIGCSVS